MRKNLKNIVFCLITVGNLFYLLFNLSDAGIGTEIAKFLLTIFLVIGTIYLVEKTYKKQESPICNNEFIWSGEILFYFLYSLFMILFFRITGSWTGSNEFLSFLAIAGQFVVAFIVSTIILLVGFLVAIFYFPSSFESWYKDVDIIEHANE